ncbi:hypothetical protein SAMN05216525_13080 [Bradyrhizobium sp. Gha]|nr:hypothetical protein SAMN05216525_13080 [Bradyrhizobium sp. Gha]
MWQLIGLDLGLRDPDELKESNDPLRQFLTR